MKRAVILYLVMVHTALAGESIIVPESAVSMFYGQVLAASTPVTSSTSYVVEKSRKVTVEVDLGRAPFDAETVVITPLYTLTSTGNPAGFAVGRVMTSTDSVTLSNPMGANLLLEFTPPSGVYSMDLMVNSSYTNTIDVSARGK